MKERKPEYETITPLTGFSASFIASQGWHVRMIKKNKDRMKDYFYVWTDSGREDHVRRSDFFSFCTKGNGLLRWSKRKRKFKRDYKQ